MDEAGCRNVFDLRVFRSFCILLGPLSFSFVYKHNQSIERTTFHIHSLQKRRGGHPFGLVFSPRPPSEIEDAIGRSGTARASPETCSGRLQFAKPTREKKQTALITGPETIGFISSGKKSRKKHAEQHPINRLLTPPHAYQ